MDMLADEPLHTSTDWLTRNTEAVNKPGFIHIHYRVDNNHIGRGAQCTVYNDMVLASGALYSCPSYSKYT